ncbi:hypothetical protein CN481_05035 [Bacillus sp. AFS006103]|nr:hypothetical protein CN481_05035 [Bacillus sp. AFS006103]
MSVRFDSIKVKSLIYFVIIYNLIIPFFVNDFSFPSATMYLADFINIILCLFSVGKFFRLFNKIGFGLVLISILLYLGSLVIGIILNSVSPLLILWAMRNTFRFFVFFIACICFLEASDINKIFNLLYKLQIINFILSLYQHFYLGLYQDRLGGIFGTQVGSNQYSNIFFCIILIHSVVSYLHKKATFTHMAFVILSTVILAVFAELKFYYIEMVIIIFLSLLFCRPNRKTFTLVLLSIFAVILGLNILKNVAPLSYSVLTNYTNLMSYADISGIGGYNLSRINAFQQINHMFFNNNILLNLFGFGFGNAEMSSVSPLLTSDFYQQYGYLNYRWFAQQMQFIQTGYVGVALFLFFFISILICSLKIRKQMTGNKEYIAYIGVLVPILIINNWYNNAISTDVAYLTFFSLSVVAVIYKKQLKR